MSQVTHHNAQSFLLISDRNRYAGSGLLLKFLELHSLSGKGFSFLEYLQGSGGSSLFNQYPFMLSFLFSSHFFRDFLSLKSLHFNCHLLEDPCPFFVDLFSFNLDLSLKFTPF